MVWSHSTEERLGRKTAWCRKGRPGQRARAGREGDFSGQHSLCPGEEGARPERSKSRAKAPSAPGPAVPATQQHWLRHQGRGGLRAHSFVGPEEGTADPPRPPRFADHAGDRHPKVIMVSLCLRNRNSTTFLGLPDRRRGTGFWGRARAGLGLSRRVLYPLPSKEQTQGRGHTEPRRGGLNTREGVGSGPWRWMHSRQTGQRRRVGAERGSELAVFRCVIDYPRTKIYGLRGF